VGCSTGPDALNVGEVWVDLNWEGGELAINQDAARQALCDWIDGHKGHAAAFDFVTKGVLQVGLGLMRATGCLGRGG
jgi:alpha-amylase